MASTYGRKFKVTLDGTAHGPEVSVKIEGIPEGTVIDFNELDGFMSRRSAQGLDFSTDRKEPDDVNFRSGVLNFGGELGIVTKSVVEAYVENKDTRPEDYEKFSRIPRPGHADFAALMKDGPDAEISGGGRFSGRLTVGLCIAGGIAKQLLAKRDIHVMADILSIGGDDEAMDFEDIIGAASGHGDSVGGVIECGVLGLKAGSCGDSYWDGLEGRISEAVFGIPAVKGVEFGNGFRCADILGSQNNDPFAFDEEGNVITLSNNHGGILGGIASGQPVVLRCAIKPTPSISKPQQSVNLEKGVVEELVIEGRHDACIVPRALPCVESAVAIAILDALMEAEASDGENSIISRAGKLMGEGDPEGALSELRAGIDELDRTILDCFSRRMDIVKEVGKVKVASGRAVQDEGREALVLKKAAEAVPSCYSEYAEELMAHIMTSAKHLQRSGNPALMDASSEEARRIGEKVSPYGLLGEKLSHSLSPEVHQMIGEFIGEPYEYALFEKKPGELEGFLKNENWKGLNVTIPFKEKVIPYLDGRSQEAAKIGAVNTIVRKPEGLIGYNTDYYGFMNALGMKGIDPAGKKCLVLGSGGASKAVCAVLDDMGAGEIVVISRKTGKAGLKEAGFNSESFYAPISVAGYEDLNDHRDAEIMVNTTPVGMYPNTGKCPVYPGSFPKLEWVIDLIYNPLRTNLICQAERAGIGTMSGMEMLASQAIYSYMIFDGCIIDNRDELTEIIVKKLTEEKKNLVLIGMPGVGKTTIGRLLAEKLGREFYDTDKMIVDTEGRQISEIFEADGEDYFRSVESAVCMEAGEKTGAVIALGGGVVTREENYYALAENSEFIFLDKAPLSEGASNAGNDGNGMGGLPGNKGFAEEGRPLTKALGIERIYKMRYPLYESWADITVDMTELTAEEAVNEIIRGKS